MRGALLRGGLLILVDGLWLGQGIVSAALAIWLLIVRVPLSYLPRHATARKERLRNIGIYLAAIVAVIGWVAVNMAISRARAEDIVAAVEAFQSKAGQYPRTLDELVPDQLPAVPRARYTLAMSEFTYAGARSGSPMLMYTAMPPFGRPFYSFKDKRWGYLD